MCVRLLLVSALLLIFLPLAGNSALVTSPATTAKATAQAQLPVSLHLPLALNGGPLNEGPIVQPETRVLVFSKTAAFRHESIPAAIAALKQLGQDNDFTVDTTEDSSQFTDANLAQYQAVVFLMTTGDVLDTSQQGAFERYIRGGRGFVGIHSASDTEYTWPWYGRLVGAYFKEHPSIQRASITIETAEHPSTRALPQPWVHTDEWYNFGTNPRSQVHVLATLDESSYEGGTMGDHPISWYHDYDGGRAWYTGAGHTPESYENAYFLQHVLGGIQYAAGITSATDPGDTGWEPLFKQASDYYTYLPSSGVNNDPKGVFTFSGDGTLHILDIPITKADQEFGYIATTQAYSRYRLRFQYKWGAKKFPPRANQPRDSGVLFHLASDDAIWPYSLELQVQENDTGDIFALRPSIGTTVRSLSDRVKQYQRGGFPFVTPFANTRIIKSETYDSLTDWNTVELIVDGDSATYIVNGNVVNSGSQFRQDADAPVPLSRGRIVFQAEGAEVLYRNIMIDAQE